MIPILHTEKLCKSFSNGAAQQHVIKNLDLEILEGDFTVIMGASGSGKSTLLYALSGMDKPTLGKVFFGDTEIQDYTNDQLAVLTGAFAVQKNSPGLIKRVKELLAKVGLDEAMQKKYPNQLSGGEAQRVGIVRAVINDPKILFADEPTGSLNSASGKDVLDIFTGVHENGQSIVMVTHDIKTALRGTRVIYLRDGKVVGEHRMAKYGEDDLKERREKLTVFLDEMGW